MNKRSQGNDESEVMSARKRWIVYLLLIFVAGSILTFGVFNAHPLKSANDRSRWSTVWSLVERGTYQIDELYADKDWQTIDKVKHEGHFYSTKPPLFPTVLAGLYWTIKKVTGWELKVQKGADVRVTRLMLVLVNLIPTIVALLVMAMIVERYARTTWARCFLLLTAGIGTLLTPFVVTLNNHTIGAYSVLFAVYPAMRIMIDGERKRRYFLLSGFWAAIACCVELPAALFGVVLFVLLLRCSAKATLSFFVPMALVPLVGFFYTNYLATGGFKPFYMFYGTEKYEYVHQGKPSYWSDPKGLDKGGDSPAIYFLHCTVGHHGIFSLSPVFLLTLMSWLGLRRWRDHALKVVLWLGLVLTVTVFGFYMTRTANYNYGGNSIALRWMLWLIPLWLIAMIPTLDRWATCRSFQVIAVILLAGSIFSAMYPLKNPWHPLSNPWQHPWLFNVMEQAGWIDYSD